MQLVLGAAFVFVGASLAAPQSWYDKQPNNIGCQTLASEYPQQLSWPNSSDYTYESQLYWSKTAVLSPYCVFTPESSQDVAGALSILRATQTQFAVRGGGHMPVRGAASTDSGVLIAMTKLNSMQLTADRSVAQLGPGLRWGAVYDWLSQYGLYVLGGRYFPVGVPGLLLGGGISYFSQQRGWAANNVVNFEVVTADSKIIEANAHSNSDLFWALKGGSNNFGIVTRFDCKTYPTNQIWGGSATVNPPQFGQFLSAVESFVAPGGGSEDTKAAVVPAILIVPGTKSVSASLTIFHDSNDPAPTALQNFTSIPTNDSTYGVRHYNDFADETAIYGDRSLRQNWYMTSVKAGAKSIQLINETVTSAGLSMKNISGLGLGISMQPITKDFVQAARTAGGDPIDLDPADGSFISVLVSGHYSDAADDVYMADFLRNTTDRLTEKAKALGLYYPFIYLNDAGAGQQPFPLYGKGNSIGRMRQIRKKYDPQGVFQRLEASGFKLN